MELTKEQQELLSDALVDGSDFPKFTRDPIVNHHVDMIVCGEPAWEELTEEDRQAYHDEVKEIYK
jgi:hypothetical protein